MTSPNTTERLPTSGQPISTEPATTSPTKFDTEFLHLPLALALDVAPLHERNLGEGGNETSGENSVATALGRNTPSSKESEEPVKDAEDERPCALAGNERLARSSSDTTAETESHVQSSATQSVELSS